MHSGKVNNRQKNMSNGCRKRISVRRGKRKRTMTSSHTPCKESSGIYLSELILFFPALSNPNKDVVRKGKSFHEWEDLLLREKTAAQSIKAITAERVFGVRSSVHFCEHPFLLSTDVERSNGLGNCRHWFWVGRSLRFISARVSIGLFWQINMEVTS